MEAKRLKPQLYAVRLDDINVVYLVVAPNAESAMRRASARHWRDTRPPTPTIPIHVRTRDPN